MGWVGSWVQIFTLVWIGLGWVGHLVGLVGLNKLDPRTTLHKCIDKFHFFVVCPGWQLNLHISNLSED